MAVQERRELHTRSRRR